MLIKIEKFFDAVSNIAGQICGIAVILMMLNVFFDVILRYFFKTGSLALQELEWHFFSIIILLGLSYSLKDDSHVRVDVLYDKFSIKTKALINIFGTIIFLFPISLLIAINSIDYAIESFQSGEISGDPGGLPFRWIVKSLIPFSFWLLSFYALGFIVKNINIYRKEGAKKC